ncbi:UDP-N-acetylglucosamine--N-acetylmuramyl-(pentapeptide) pyrophosphoryl-undecaprenol N-acetylglucosamine transferase [Candidatus Uhrbacteria bacterium]|nr:UDP-N-acetylglucosamine--N-acetylmuramyl-(pentapeptide) pyrophosphoryl-undecaprenol N-acetylglucosamine transferase [Candidatus Uhrbacteria bacterium]
MKILFTGGGTMGPVTPLLAVWEAWKAKDTTVEAIWVGTRRGPERIGVESQGIPFFTLPTARFPRYLSLEWILIPFTFLWALYQASRILRFQKPDLVASAGGFTAVPVIFAAKLHGVKVWVHQQDVEIILTNKLTIPFADLVTVAWEKNQKDLGGKGRLVGNPVRPSRLQGTHEGAMKQFGLDVSKPSVLVFGGGTGASWINQAIHGISKELAQSANIIHVTGQGKGVASTHADHYVYEFLNEEMSDALAVADVVVCRAGLSTITELAALAKAAILIPLPNSPQEANAQMVEDACIVLSESQTQGKRLLEAILGLLTNEAERKTFGLKMHKKLRTDSADELVEMLIKI